MILKSAKQTYTHTGSIPLKSGFDGKFYGHFIKKKRTYSFIHSPQLTSSSLLLDLINQDLSVHWQSLHSFTMYTMLLKD